MTTTGRLTLVILLAGCAVALAALAAALIPPRPAMGDAPTGNPLGVFLTTFASGLNEPVAIAFTGIATDTRMFVVERAGVIKIVQSNAVMPTPFLDISATVDSETFQEMGMLGLAFDPNYAANGRFYVYYTGLSSNSSHDLVLSRFNVSGNSNLASPAETIVLSVPHPDQNHNGGQLQFGPDGFLYLGPGDGGGGGDLPNNAQNLNKLLGKLLRLNVSGVSTYTVPASNPFTQTVGARPEIWAYGLRNPWRFTFDRSTNDLYIGDVGQDEWEEVDFQPAASTGGQNYGWRCFEGNHVFELSGGCPGPFVAPVAEYNHNPNGDDAITGGYVYRGSSFPSLTGYYFYADYVSGQMWAMQSCTTVVTVLGHLLSNPSTFGQDLQGELYVASLNDGIVYKVKGPPAPVAQPTMTPLFLPLVSKPIC